MRIQKHRPGRGLKSDFQKVETEHFRSFVPEDSQSIERQDVLRTASEGIPKIKVGIEARYSKKHFDIAKGIAEPEAPKEYTVAEAMEKFGMTRDQIYHYVKTYNITRTKRGKYTYISRKELDDLLAPPTI